MLAHTYLDAGQPAKAEAVTGLLDALEPDLPRNLQALALAQLRQEQFESALATLDRLDAAGGSAAASCLLRADCLAGLGRTAEATRLMQAFVRAHSPQRSD